MSKLGGTVSNKGGIMIQLKKSNKVRFYLIILLVILVNQNIAQSIPHEQHIHNAYQKWVKATNAKDIEQWASFLAPNAIFHPPNHPALNGNAEIKEYYLESFADERFSLVCNQDTVEVSEAEDFAWSKGSCEATFTGPDGKEARGKSKWVKVWERQSNGEWKCKINSWSSSIKISY